MKKEVGKSRAERPRNFIPIQPYDNTSNAYKAEPRKGSAQTRFGTALSLAVMVAIIIFFVFVYEAVMIGYERVK